MKLNHIFGWKATSPNLPTGVPLIELVVTLSRLDLKVVNEDRFIEFCSEGPALIPGQPALYN